MKNKGLSWEEHRALGVEMRAMRDRFIELVSLTGQRYGVSSAIYKRMWVLYNKQNELRSALDAVLTRDCLGLNVPTDDLNKCYYGYRAGDPDDPEAKIK